MGASYRIVVDHWIDFSCEKSRNLVLMGIFNPSERFYPAVTSPEAHFWHRNCILMMGNTHIIHATDNLKNNSSMFL